MNKDELNEFITAVDVVCGACVKCSEEVCETCPVRLSVDFYKKSK